MELYLQLKEKFPYLSNSTLIDIAEFVIDREQKARIESFKNFGQPFPF